MATIDVLQLHTDDHDMRVGEPPAFHSYPDLLQQSLSQMRDEIS